MNSTVNMRKIDEIDLDAIKAKLMHQASGEGWTAARADAIEGEYRRFLYMLHTYPDEQFAPLVDVDTFWHYHILDTRKYAADCEQTFGYFLHHNPNVALGDSERDAAEHAAFGARMHALYEKTFGQGCLGGSAAWCSLGATAWCSITGGPSKAQSEPWCSLTARRDAGQKTAWCSLNNDARDAATGTAWCSLAKLKSVARQTAWCSLNDGPARHAQTAWCSLSDDKPNAAPTAWCSLTAASCIDAAQLHAA